MSGGEREVLEESGVWGIEVLGESGVRGRERCWERVVYGGEKGVLGVFVQGDYCPKVCICFYKNVGVGRISGKEWEGGRVAERGISCPS